MNDLVRNVLMGAAGGGSKSTYVDDVFSTYVYTGTGSALTINNGIDLSSKGGMVWLKGRSSGKDHKLSDTVRGVNSQLKSESTDAASTNTNVITSFNNNGFTMGTNGEISQSGVTHASWSFRKQKGFFDTVTYTGNGTAGRTVSHSLGCEPGMIIIKNLDSTEDWRVYHRSLGGTQNILLNSYGGATGSTSVFNQTDPTASVFTVGTSDATNKNGDEFIAYLFAGGESTAATARSVDIDNDDGLNVAASSDFNFGTGQFCIECWVYVDNLPATGSPGYGRVFQQDGPTGNNAFSNLQVTINPSNNTLHAWAYGSGNPVAIVGSKNLKDGQWHHIAVNRDSNNLITQYVDGIPDGTVTTTTNFNPNSGSPRPRIGIYDTGGTNGVFNGKISNLRVTVGEPVYTSAFRPSTTPLTTSSQGVTASNVKLLCCNNSSTTGSTTTSGTITANGDPTASTDSPFDDPEGFQFGEEGDQNIIKCGSYKTDGNEDANVYLGWEPSWVLVKRSDGTSPWMIVDSMRGFPNAQDIQANTGDCKVLEADENVAEANTHRLGLTSTGFYADQYGANRPFIYIAIRRSDGLVGKPAEAGTDAFAMDAGNNTSYSFDAGFPVDMGLYRRPSQTENWYIGNRLMGGKELVTSSTIAEFSAGNTFDSNTAWANGYNSTYQSWMWKRNAGFDVVTGLEENNSHNLGKPIEMIWVKRSDNTSDWFCWHKGLNGGGSNAVNYHVRLNTTAAESSISSLCPIGDTLPTATHFKTGSDSDIRNAGSIAFLFASVDGISKCGYYSGTGYAGHVITTGFTPRFLIIKTTTASNGWFTYDSLRGLGAGADPYLQLQANNAQDTSGADVFATSSTGFTINQTYSSVNASGQKYIYYAHA